MESYLFEVKAMLRSILISSPLALNVSELDNDFKEQEGIGIPFRKFGFKSLLEFLNSIPDVLEVKGKSKCSNVYPVASEKSLHINEMVMKQKSSSLKPGHFFSQSKRSSNKSGSNKNFNERQFHNIPSSKEQGQFKQASTLKATIKPDDGYSSQKSSSEISSRGKKHNLNDKKSSLHSLEFNEGKNISLKNSINEKSSPQNYQKDKEIKNIPSEYTSHQKSLPSKSKFENIYSSPEHCGTQKVTTLHCSNINEVKNTSLKYDTTQNNPSLQSSTKFSKVKYDSAKLSTTAKNCTYVSDIKNILPKCDSNQKSPSSQGNTKYSKVKNNSPKLTINKTDSLQNDFIGMKKSSQLSLMPDLKATPQRLTSNSIKIKNSIEFSGNENANGSTKFLRSRNYNDDSLNTASEDTLPSIDVSLRGTNKQKELPHWSGGVIKKTKMENTNLYDSEAEQSSGQNNLPSIGSDFFKDTNNDFMRSMLKMKTEKQKKYNKKGTLMQRKIQNFIPKHVEDNLQKLISDFPDGIWCSELPVAYKNLLGEELRFENYGYLNLFCLCFDLNHVFHCVKESSCDYKLYDARKPVPEFNIVEENSFRETITTELEPAIPEMIWGSFDSFVPEDAIKLGFKMKKIQAANSLEAGMHINVIVGEIYDISKFWIILDNHNLENLMDEIHFFYEANKQKYLVQRSLLEEGLYCVVLYKNKFHRAVILNKMPGEEYLKVYYFDYGTLGMISKSEVWFLTREFAELPSQAIRSRLADIYPPYSRKAWSPSANCEFSTLTCMKRLIAEIVRVDKNKNLCDIKLKKGNRYISDILIANNHAISIRIPPRKHIEDPNCKPRVQYVQLFPTFEEIENWVVPSLEQASEFLDTTVTADFLYSQYFSRTSFKDSLEKIEQKVTAISKKKKALMRYVKPNDSSSLHDINEMNRFAYGSLYECYRNETGMNYEVEECSKGENIEKTDVDYEVQESIKENIIEENEIFYQVEQYDRGEYIVEENYATEVENEDKTKDNNRIIDIENDELLIGILRQTRMRKSLSFEEEKQNDVLGAVFHKMHLDNTTVKSIEVKEDKSNSNSNAKDNISTLPNTIPKVLGEFINFSEIEKYLSETDSSRDASKKSFSNLIDLDDEFSRPIVSSSINLLSDPEFEQSEEALKRIKKNQKCLLTEYSLTDPGKCLSENPLDLPIPDNFGGSQICDLIQFDVEVSSSEIASTDSQEVSESGKPILHSGPEFGDADDEDSDDKLDPLKNLQNTLTEKFDTKSVDQNTLIKKDHHRVLNIPQLKCRNSINSNLDVAEFAETRFVDENNMEDNYILDSSLENQSTIGKQGSTATSSFYEGSTLKDSTEYIELEILKTPTTPNISYQGISRDNTNENMETEFEFLQATNFDSQFADLNMQNGNQFKISDIQGSSYQTVADCASSNDGKSALIEVTSLHQSMLQNEQTDSPYFSDSVIVESEELEGELKTSANSNYLDNGSDMDLQTTRSTEMDHSCNSIVPDSIDNTANCNSFRINGNTDNTSTPLLKDRALGEDKSFLEEFDIINPSPISSPFSDMRSEANTSRLSFVSGEWLSLELPAGQLENEVNIQNSQTIKTEAHVNFNSNTLVKEEPLKNHQRNNYPSNIENSQVDPPNNVQHVPSASGVNYVPYLSAPPMMSSNSNSRGPVFQGPRFLMNQPRSVLRPPPGFMPITPYSHSQILYPFGNQPNYFNPYNTPYVPKPQLSIQQQEIVNEVARNYSNYPIVVFNYNIQPPPYANVGMNEVKK